MVLLVVARGRDHLQAGCQLTTPTEAIFSSSRMLIKVAWHAVVRNLSVCALERIIFFSARETLSPARPMESRPGIDVCALAAPADVLVWGVSPKTASRGWAVRRVE